jgi:putative ABC transport system ATP-binding protein
MSDATAIDVRDVVKEFDGGRIRALAGMSLRVEPGEFVAITGRSGCGKSTLLHLLAALDTPTSGSIRVNGRDLADVKHLNEYRRREVGLVFQLHNLLPHLTALQNVEVAMLGTGRSHREQRERATALLAEVGLADRVSNRPPQLSGGERQRVAIARALANNPAVMLADEPTGSLDTESVASVLELLRQVQAEHHTTIVMVTHDPVLAAAADRVVRMRDGRLDGELPANENASGPSALARFA